MRIFAILIIAVTASCSVLNVFDPSRIQTNINLSRQGLKTIPDEVYENTEIKVLKLFMNDLDSLSPRIAEMQSLEKLYIGKNKLKTLPPEIGELKNLKLLSIQYNDLEVLPDEIGDLSNLEQLVLNQNNLTHLPSTIGQLKNLSRLDLNFNSLEELPNEITDCTNLQFLYMNRNNMRALPDSIGNLRRLKELHLNNAGPLLDVPESLCDIRNLEYLVIDGTIAIPPCLLVLKANRLQIVVR